MQGGWAIAHTCSSSSAFQPGVHPSNPLQGRCLSLIHTHTRRHFATLLVGLVLSPPPGARPNLTSRGSAWPRGNLPGAWRGRGGHFGSRSSGGLGFPKCRGGSQQKPGFSRSFPRCLRAPKTKKIRLGISEPSPWSRKALQKGEPPKVRGAVCAKRGREARLPPPPQFSPKPPLQSSLLSADYYIVLLYPALLIRILCIATQQSGGGLFLPLGQTGVGAWKVVIGLGVPLRVFAASASIGLLV